VARAADEYIEALREALGLIDARGEPSMIATAWSVIARSQEGD